MSEYPEWTNMDRKYKAKDKVHVYQSDKHGPLLDTFEQQPYTVDGMDNYLYKSVMYKGFFDMKGDFRTYILLDKPLDVPR